MSRQHLLRGAAVAGALLLASCGTLSNGPLAEVDPEEAYPITVGPHMERLTIAPGADASTQLAAFAGGFNAQGNGSVTISAPTADAASAYAARLENLGVPRGRIVVGAPSGMVELSYVGYGASSPSCDNWFENVADTWQNLPTPNFGCATQHNVATMVADPRDLVTPQPMTPPDTTRRMIVIEKWRNGEPTGATKTEEQSAEISTVTQH